LRLKSLRHKSLSAVGCGCFIPAVGCVWLSAVVGWGCLLAAAVCSRLSAVCRSCVDVICVIIFSSCCHLCIMVRKRASAAASSPEIAPENIRQLTQQVQSITDTIHMIKSRLDDVEQRALNNDSKYETEKIPPGLNSPDSEVLIRLSDIEASHTNLSRSLEEYMERLNRLETLIFMVPDLRKLDKAVQQLHQIQKSMEEKDLHFEGQDFHERCTQTESNFIFDPQYCDSGMQTDPDSDSDDLAPNDAHLQQGEGEWLVCNAQCIFQSGQAIRIDANMKSNNAAIELQKGLLGEVLKYEEEDESSEASVLLRIPCAKRINQDEHWVTSDDFKNMSRRDVHVAT